MGQYHPPSAFRVYTEAFPTRGHFTIPRTAFALADLRTRPNVVQYMYMTCMPGSSRVHDTVFEL